MNKTIAMSLYGDLDMYKAGAIENIRIRKQFYPDWNIHIYVSEAMPELDCETIVMGESLEHSGMFWRFLALWDGITIVRDTDSRFNNKEVAAVKAWEKSRHIAHAMHDHDHHRCFPLFGGMFGVKGDYKTEGQSHSLQDLHRPLYRAMSLPEERVADMKWLQRYLWPYIEKDTLHHSSVPLKWNRQPFPLQEEGYFVGQQHDDNGPVWA